MLQYTWRCLCLFDKLISFPSYICIPRNGITGSYSSSIFIFWGTHMYMYLVTQSRPTHCGPMDYSPPGSSVHGILQARILEWTAISFSRGSSQPSDWTRVSCIAGRFFTIWVTRGALPNSFSDPKGKTCFQSLRNNFPVHKSSLEAPLLVLKTLFPSSWEIKPRQLTQHWF